MAKKSTIKTIHWVTDRDWPNWKVWYFDMTMENWDRWQIGKMNQTAMQLGMELHYDITPNPKKAWQFKIAEVKEEEATPVAWVHSNKGYGRNYEADMISFAMSYAKDLVIADKVSLTQLPAEAERIYTRMIGQYKLLDK